MNKKEIIARLENIEDILMQKGIAYIEMKDISGHRLTEYLSPNITLEDISNSRVDKIYEIYKGLEVDAMEKDIEKAKKLLQENKNSPPPLKKRPVPSDVKSL